MKVGPLIALAVVSLVVITLVGPMRAQNGAAVYRTDRGGFDALFLPKPQNLEGLPQP